MYNLDFLCRSSLMGTTLRAVPSKSHAFSTNYHACIAMPTWCRCSPPILFWHWPPFNLFPGSCITWIFFVDSHWWVPLRAGVALTFRHIANGETVLLVAKDMRSLRHSGETIFRVNISNTPTILSTRILILAPALLWWWASLCQDRL